MAQSTARQIFTEPASPEVHKTRKKAERQSKQATYLKTEKIMVVLIAAWISVLACFVIASTINLNSAQVELQKVNTSITAIQSKNANTKQEVGELTSRSRLDAFAKKAGLSMKEQNTRNVSK